MLPLMAVKHILTISVVIFDKITIVTDRQTDGENIAIARNAIAV